MGIRFDKPLIYILRVLAQIIITVEDLFVQVHIVCILLERCTSKVVKDRLIFPCARWRYSLSTSSSASSVYCVGVQHGLEPKTVLYLVKGSRVGLAECPPPQETSLRQKNATGNVILHDANTLMSTSSCSLSMSRKIFCTFNINSASLDSAKCKKELTSSNNSLIFAARHCRSAFSYAPFKVVFTTIDPTASNACNIATLMV